MTISAQSGLIAQNNFFDKQVASQNLSNYLLLYKGDFAYNKSYSNGYPYGAVKRLEKFNCGVVSSLYIAFKPTHVLPNFLAEYYETTKWYVEIYKRAAEGARNHGLLNISATDFFNSDISLPKGEDEQEKIGQLFQSLDKTITLHEEQHRQLERLKKALLQKMFADETGYPALRFKGFTAKWEQRKLGDITRRYDNLRVPVTASKRKHGDIPYYGANGIQDFVSGYTHDGEFILVAEDGARDPKNYPVNYVNGKIWVNNHAHVLQGIQGLANNLFLLNGIKKINIVAYLVGGSRAKLNAETLMQLSIKLPSIHEQEKIGQLFQSLDKTITLHDKKIQYLKKLKRGLLQKMFV